MCVLGAGGRDGASLSAPSCFPENEHLLNIIENNFSVLLL